MSYIRIDALTATLRESARPSIGIVISPEACSNQGLLMPVRSLLSALVRLPWQATAAHHVLEALSWLQDLYAHDQRSLPSDVHVFLGSVWREALAGSDREHAFCAFEVATLLGLRRALRNGTVWIDHSLAFRSREKLFIPAAQWQTPHPPCAASRSRPPAWAPVRGQ